MFSEIPFKVRQQLYLSGEPAVRAAIVLKGEQREHLWVLNSSAEGPENLVSEIVFHKIWKRTKE